MRLRWAVHSDKDFFLRVRNDSAAIRFSYSKQPLTREMHDRWWKETSDSLFVAEEDRGWYQGYGFGQQPVSIGTVRLSEVDDATCEIHLALDPAERGKGYAAGMLREAREQAKQIGYSHIIARVDSPNTPSLRAFLRDGYSVKSPGTLLLERPL